jgi:hypothetical protein
MKYFIDAYEDLGSKINKFIQYVEKDWNKTRTLINS